MIARHYDQRGHLALLPDDEAEYQGLVPIVGNDPERRTFLIDQPSPVQARHLKLARQVKVQGVIDQLLVWFYVNELPEVVEGDDRYYRLPYPKQVQRLQRRNAFRVNLPPGVSGVLAFCAGDAGRDVRSARVHDLSATGCAIEMSLEETQIIPPGTVVEAARIRVAGLLDLKFRFEVRNLRPISEKRGLVGLHFVDMPAVEAQKIDRAVMHLQRMERAD